MLGRITKGARQYWILLDPDDFSPREASRIVQSAEGAGGVDAVLIGGSLLHHNSFDAFVKSVRAHLSIPVILFPGDATQLSGHADALLYLSLISGRNPVNLISEHVKAAPIIRRLGLEPIATAYMLVESGAVTSVEFMSNTRPLPRAKADIAAAHALAAQYMGMKMVYLEAGSGAPQTVPCEMIQKVKELHRHPSHRGRRHPRCRNRRLDPHGRRGHHSDREPAAKKGRGRNDEEDRESSKGIRWKIAVALSNKPGGWNES